MAPDERVDSGLAIWNSAGHKLSGAKGGKTARRVGDPECCRQGERWPWLL